WNTPDLLRHWREAWASLANVRLAECGHDVRIDHRSYKALKLDLKPQVKLGGCVHRREAEGAETDLGTADNETLTINGAKIIASPGLALAAITVQQSVFTERDIARFLHGHTIDADQFQNALTAVKASPLLVDLGRDDRGETRYTTRKMLALERGLATTALTL
ncbi:MobA/MobL protein, partial [mine drainage metagenome]